MTGDRKSRLVITIVIVVFAIGTVLAVLGLLQEIADGATKISAAQEAEARIAQEAASRPASKSIPEPRPAVVSVDVDYGVAVSQAISSGNFLGLPEIIAQLQDGGFAEAGQGRRKRDMAPVEINEPLEMPAVLAKINAEGFRPATLKEMLAWAKMASSTNEKKIVALGSSRHVRHGKYLEGTDYPILVIYPSKAHLLIRNWYGGVWTADYAFLAVRKN